MSVFLSILIAVFFCVIPSGVLWLCGKVRLLGKIGPVLILYFIGIVIGNIGLDDRSMKSVQDILSSAMVPLAIPMMLFGCSFRNNNTRSQILALVTGLAAVSIAVVTGYFIFGTNIPDGEKVGGMLSGVYTGGTINLAALKTMLGASDEVYILMNSYDLVVSFLYLSFLMIAGIKLFRRFLDGKRPHMEESGTTEDAIVGNPDQNPYKGLFTLNGLKQLSAITGLTLLVCAVSGGIAFLVPDGLFMTVFILLLTSFGIAFSFFRYVRTLNYSYDAGMYLIYIFCITVASMADFSELDLKGGMYLMGYLLFVVFGSLFLQALLAKVFRIDADTMVISSVTFINSPPFVPMIAAVMNNRKVLAAGLSIGVIGYAVGNYLGFLIYNLLLRL